MAAKKTSTKKLTLDLLVKDSNKFNKLEKVTFENGFHIEIYRNLSNPKIDFILRETMAFMDEMVKGGALETLEIEDLIQYGNFHLVIYGTGMGVDKEFTYEEKVQILERIVEHDCYEMIIRAFTPEDMNKVWTRMKTMLENYVELLKTDPLTQEKLSALVTNTEASESGESEDANIQ